MKISQILKCIIALLFLLNCTSPKLTSNDGTAIKLNIDSVCWTNRVPLLIESDFTSGDSVYVNVYSCFDSSFFNRVGIDSIKLLLQDKFSAPVPNRLWTMQLSNETHKAEIGRSDSLWLLFKYNIISVFTMAPDSQIMQLVQTRVINRMFDTNTLYTEMLFSNKMYIYEHYFFPFVYNNIYNPYPEFRGVLNSSSKSYLVDSVSFACTIMLSDLSDSTVQALDSIGIKIRSIADTNVNVIDVYPSPYKLNVQAIAGTLKIPAFLGFRVLKKNSCCIVYPPGPSF